MPLDINYHLCDLGTTPIQYHQNPSKNMNHEIMHGEWMAGSFTNVKLKHLQPFFDHYSNDMFQKYLVVDPINAYLQW